MAQPGTQRERLSEQLNAAYGAGLLSPATFAERCAVLGAPVIAPERIVGDLSVRVARRGGLRRLADRAAGLVRSLATGDRAGSGASLLALDWSGDAAELTIGRAADCDIVLRDPFVSRRHARLTLRDGAWILHDLDSHNGCLVNGVRVQRCRLAPGDTLALGGQRLVVD